MHAPWNGPSYRGQNHRFPSTDENQIDGDLLWELEQAYRTILATERELQRVNEQFADDIRQLHSEMAALEQTMRGHEYRGNRLEQSIHSLKHQNQSLGKANESLRKENRRLGDAERATQNRVASAEGQIKTGEKERESLHTSLQQQTHRNRKLQQDYETLKSQLTQKDQRVARLLGTIEQLSRLVKALRTDHEAGELLVADLDQRCAELEMMSSVISEESSIPRGPQLDRLIAESQRLTEQLNSAYSCLQASANESGRLQETIDRLSKQKRTLEQRLHDAEALAKHQHDDTEDLNAELTRLRADTSQQRSELDRRAQHLAEQANQIAALQGELERSKATKDVSDETSSLRRTRDLALRNSISQAQRSAELENQLRDARNEIVRLSNLVAKSPSSEDSGPEQDRRAA